MKVDQQGNVKMTKNDAFLREQTILAVRNTSSLSSAANHVGVSRQTFHSRFHRYFGPGKLGFQNG